VRVGSLTFLVSVLDTDALGASGLGMFATPESIEAARRGSQLRGFLDGREMASTFAWLRPNDLIWNYWVNNVLLGKDPPAFDVLYWNNDTTRLPARLHADFLRIFGENALAHAGALHIHGVPVDLARIRCDSYFIAGVTDHLTPWRTCWAGAQRLGGRTTFVLSNSGHIQCILNPPGNRKAEFRVGLAGADDPELWLAAAERRADSWWPHWHEWLGARSGAAVPAPRQLGSAEHPPERPAPGAYVHE
jgi:poly[(R)-3-hydroxyalkanoate] polymerase subunit PhaC